MRHGACAQADRRDTMSQQSGNGEGKEESRAEAPSSADSPRRTEDRREDEESRNTGTDSTHHLSALNRIPKWSIEHPYAVIAFYVAMLGLAWMTVSQTMPRRFAPCVESPVIGIVTRMPGL